MMEPSDVYDIVFFKGRALPKQLNLWTFTIKAAISSDIDFEDWLIDRLINSSRRLSASLAF